MANVGDLRVSLRSREEFDSRPDTWRHIHQVRFYMGEVVKRLMDRAHVHDMSKLQEPELAVFDRITPRLRNATYPSAEYDELRAAVGDGLKHHYENNDHHPEHFENGVADMDLLQVMEMLADWKAATLRHENGDLRTSIEHNANRFGYGEEFKRLLMNTARNMGWLT